jgi:hypothetical protein
MESPFMFVRPDLYVKVLTIASVYQYRLVARRFIEDLFDGVDVSPKTIDLLTSLDTPVQDVSRPYEEKIRPELEVQSSSTNAKPSVSFQDRRTEAVIVDQQELSGNEPRLTPRFTLEGFKA